MKYFHRRVVCISHPFPPRRFLFDFSRPRMDAGVRADGKVKQRPESWAVISDNARWVVSTG